MILSPSHPNNFNQQNPEYQCIEQIQDYRTPIKETLMLSLGRSVSPPEEEE